MEILNQVSTSVLYVVERAAQQAPSQPLTTSTLAPATATSSIPSATTTAASSSGGSSSPLLFFVALGFGVVFTNLWIIVGVKYCFRYNARNRALRNGEVVDPITLDNMPTRPHRRRREKKLMTMDEVNERFPLSKYKNWVATRASEGLSTSGGVAAAPSRAASVRGVDAIVPSLTADGDPLSSESKVAVPGAVTAIEELGETAGEQKSMEASSPITEEHHGLKEVQTTDSIVDKDGHPTGADEDEDDDDDEHIHTALAPELLANPGDSCAICIDTLEPDDDIRGLTCGHAFHAGCLDPWLTSRRACCPLCKADYYIPKPRPEGEAADTDRSGRRGRMPPPPPPTWTGMRGNRLMLSSRFVATSMVGDGVGYGPRPSRREARERRAAPIGALSVPAPSVPAPDPAERGDAASRRWRPRISNPFRAMHIPTISVPGRARTADTAPEEPTEPSPSQLEAGVNR